MVNVTIKVDKITKAAMDIVAAKLYAQTGKSVTNDQLILRLLMEHDPEAVKQAQAAGKRTE